MDLSLPLPPLPSPYKGPPDMLNLDLTIQRSPPRMFKLVHYYPDCRQESGCRSTENPSCIVCSRILLADPPLGPISFIFIQFSSAKSTIPHCIRLCNCSIGQNIAGNNYRSTSVSIMYELLVGDKLYAVGVQGALVANTGQENCNVFGAHILYKSLI